MLIFGRFCFDICAGQTPSKKIEKISSYREMIFGNIEANYINRPTVIHTFISTVGKIALNSR